MGPGRNWNREWSQGVAAVWSSRGPELGSAWSWVLPEAEELDSSGGGGLYDSSIYWGRGVSGYCVYDSVGDLYIQD